jgi:AcrR family transcriptional regulator
MPRKVNGEERRAALADAVVRRIAAAGMEGTKLRDVAAEAGWTTGALTHYFADKRELLKLAMASSFERLHGRSVAELKAGGDELQILLEQALPLDPDRTAYWKVTLAFYVQSWSDPEFAGILKQNLRDWRARIVTLLGAATSSGRFRAGLDGERTADELIALVDGIAMQALYDPARWPASKQRTMLLDQLKQLHAKPAVKRGR